MVWRQWYYGGGRQRKNLLKGFDGWVHSVEAAVASAKARSTTAKRAGHHGKKLAAQHSIFVLLSDLERLTAIRNTLMASLV